MTNNLIAPLRNIPTEQKPWEGNCAKKPWEYLVTAVIPVLDTPDTLEVVIGLLQLQTVKPYIIIIDTGSDTKNYQLIEALRCENVEVHKINMHGTPHPSDFPAVAMDLAFSMCRTDYLFATHADCFLRRQDFIEEELNLCNEQMPVVGYELSPRAHHDWKGMFGHTVTMFHMPTMDRCGAGWSLRRLCNQFGIAWEPNANGDNWPDTELCLNYLLRKQGIKPLLIGHDQNYIRQVDDNIDHVRSLTGALLYSPNNLPKTLEWKAMAIIEGQERINRWSGKEPIAYTKKSVDKPKFVDNLVCVVVYNRIDNIICWLRAWQKADKMDAKIAIIHNYDGDLPNLTERERILAHNPDYYIMRSNRWWDLGAFEDVVFDKFPELPDCENLYWFTDDLLPMRPQFFQPFVNKLNTENVGMVGQCYEPCTKIGGYFHFRTVAFGIKKEVARRLIFPAKENECNLDSLKRWLLYIESGPNNITQQVKRMGFEIKVCHGGEIDAQDYMHWPCYLDWMWDVEMGVNNKEQMKQLFEEQFKDDYIRKRDDLITHPRMILDMTECERLTSIKQQFTAIIATQESPIEMLLWSIFSLLMRSDPGKLLAHIIVSINGPDHRTGDPTLQDQKQAFLEELRDLKWQNIAMPLTIQRIWSRIGHAQAIESAIPWVHTEGYLLVHDDVIVLNKSWQDYAQRFIQDGNYTVGTTGDHTLGNFTINDHDQLTFPHLSSVFTLCNKPLLAGMGARWIGYTFPLKYYIGEFVSYTQFANYHRNHSHIEPDSPEPRDKHQYESISMDFGSWMHDKVENCKYKKMHMPEDFIHHFVGGSWLHKDIINQPWHASVHNLEKDLRKNDSFMKLYRKYIPTSR